MESCKENSRNSHHNAIEDDEFIFVLHDLVPPSGAKLGNTVDATGEDGDVCDKETGDEELEATCGKKAGAAGCEATSGADHIVEDEGSESQESDDLPNDTSYHEICANLLTI